jgi:DNA-binding transcriptional ArsR family regulator
LSLWRISKELKLPKENVRYHLRKLVKDGIIKKSESRYVFPYDILIKNGLIIVRLVDSFGLFSCPYFNGCKCGEKEIRNCKYMKEFPKKFHEFIKRKMSS